jgi:hypothetical protein
MKFVVDKASLVSVADAIRTKGGTTEELQFPQGFVSAVNAIESGGGGAEEIENIIDASGVLDSTDGTVTEKVEQLIDKAEQTRLWDLVVFKNSAFQNQNSPFMNWAEKTIPKINFGEITTLIYSFSNSNVEYIDYYINSKKATNFNSCFSNCKKLVWLVGVDTSSATYCTEIFQNCTSLESITEPFDVSKITSFNKAFNGCEKLKEIRFVAETIRVSIAFVSPVLSAESIQSIIDGLATVETAQTLTLHADVKAKLTQTQLDTITNKNWNLA